MGTKCWLRCRRGTSLITYMAIGAIFAVTAGITSPSSASELTKKTPVHPVTTAVAAKQFLEDDAPFAAARTAYAKAFASWEAAKRPFSTTTNFVDPFVEACKTFAQKLDSQRWPQRARVYAHIFGRSLVSIENDVNALPSLTTLSGVRALAAKFATDSATSLRDSNALRGVLDVAPVLS
jgi:hypothetical protein